MIKLTEIKSDKITNRYAVIIPGGPGLSSLTLRSLDTLKRSLNLIYVDFHGTNGVPYLKDATHEDLCSALEEKLKRNLPADGKSFLIGHSYGGIVASSIAHLDYVKGLFCLGVPFSKRTIMAINNCYAKNMTPALSKAEKVFDEKKDDQSFREWLAEYGEMYFLNPRGREILLNDKVSAKGYLANTGDLEKADRILKQILKLNKPKFFIAGKQDKLIPESELREDAQIGGFKFLSVNNASHFMTFDQPEVVARLIEENIAAVN